MSLESDKLEQLPPYLFARINSLKLARRQAGHDVIDLGMGNPDRPAPPHVIEKLCEVARDPKAHRYSASRGITHLRKAVCEWYEKRHNVSLDPESEVVALLGSKEGVSHLFLALLNRGDGVLVPSPSYPIHSSSVLLAGGHLYELPLTEESEFLTSLSEVMGHIFPKPKAIVLSYPHNPTTKVVELGFFEEIVAFAKAHDLLVIHDLAYAEICFDGYKAPSFLQAKGAKEVGIEFYSLSKTFNMAGWRVGFALGNARVIATLSKLKSYYDYGIFTPVQVAAIAALKGPEDCYQETVRVYKKRRDVMVEALNRIGWAVESPRATLYIWARIPEPYRDMGSLAFCEKLLNEADVAASPGIGFGDLGEGYVRLALVENEQRIRQAVRGIRKALDKLKGEDRSEVSKSAPPSEQR